MNNLRKILTPLSALYREITKIRNKAYDKEIISSVEFDFPVITVGNLSTGGTGKTPQVEYLIRLLQSEHKIAVLSRGYKRKTKGFIIANRQSTAQDIGDEPLQYFRKFKDLIVAVDADRVNGIKKLHALKSPPDIILLDDAFQHRKVKAGLNILLTPFNNLYSDDKILPAGNLREDPKGADRAEIIVVTKCKGNLSEKEQFEIAKKLKLTLEQTVFFSKIEYDESVRSEGDEIKVSDLKSYEILLVTGIASTDPLTDFLKEQKISFEHLKYADHYNFTEKDLKKIWDKFSSISSQQKIILTTEKDYVRTFKSVKNRIYYLPIRTKFIDHEEDFNLLIHKYVRKYSGDRKIS